MTAAALSVTPLHEWHVAHGGRMVDFAGWSMPVQYGSIVDEHRAVRHRCGMFDVSHMGRLQFSGPDSVGYLDRVLTRRVADIRVGEIRYSLVCNEAGGILDDVLVYCLSDDAGAAPERPPLQLVVNASNRAKIKGHLDAELKEAPTHLSDVTESTAMIAVQGPDAMAISKSLLQFAPDQLGYYRGVDTQVLGPGSKNYSCYLSRTGYTGEDGIEVIADAQDAEPIWNLFHQAGAVPCGLAARDTLRLEAAMPLYGHELSEAINPWQAGLRFAVNLKDRQFIGSEALRQNKNNSEQPVRVGLEIEGKRPAREGAAILQPSAPDGDRQVGRVTSGTFSPTLGRPIAMGFVQPEWAKIGQQLTVDIRGKQHQTQITGLPFYKREAAS